ncbi:MAG TPA: hypothetical protein VE482_03990, partial [Candidatus Eisenbacteria bacterium]|nr:hypothetical protein [Candidatus Eisenbacteria bacterium]
MVCLRERYRAEVVSFGGIQMAHASTTLDLSQKVAGVSLSALVFLSLAKIESPRADRGGLVDEAGAELP